MKVGKGKLANLVASNLALILLVVSGFQFAVPAGRAVGQQGNNRQIGFAPLNNATSIPASLRYLGNVTLITGDRLLIYSSSGGSLRVAVLKAQPASREAFSVLDRGTDLFVIPTHINLRVFDLSLFNVRLLLNSSKLTGGNLGVIFQTSSPASASKLTSYLKSQGYRAATLQGHLHFATADIGTDDRAKMHDSFSGLPQVNRAWLDRAVTVDSTPWVGGPNVRFIGAPYAWAHGFNGTGERIAIVDTGISSTHPDFFFPNGTSKIIRAADFSTDRTTEDLHGHGTHTASIAAGTGASSGGTYAGVAPGAALINAKVLSGDGFGLTSWVIQGVQYAIDNHATAISMSLGGSSFDESDPLSEEVNLAVQGGIAVAVAAGNDGCYYCISTPGVASGATTVGASDNLGGLAYFSSKGPTQDGRIKPDILAPGLDVTAARLGGGYAVHSGTSMATPHVSGAYALLAQRYPALTPGQIKDLIVSTATDNPVLNVYSEGGGELNVESAMTSDLMISPSELNFQGSVGGSSRIVAIKNIGASTLILAVTETGHRLGEVSGLDTISANASSISIAAGATAHLNVTVNPSLPSGVYDGKLFLTDGSGRVYKVIAGLYMLFPLRVQKIDLRGSYENSSGYFDINKLIIVFKLDPSSVADALQNTKFAFLNSTGTATMWVTPGTYEVLSPSAYLNVSSAFNFQDSVPVHSPSLVTLDDRSMNPVTFDPGIPFDEMLSSMMLQFNLNMTTSPYIRPLSIAMLAFEFGSSPVYLLHPTSFYTYGASYIYTSPGFAFTSDYTLYHLFFSGPDVSSTCCSFAPNYANTVDRLTQYRTQADSSDFGLVLSFAVGRYASEYYTLIAFVPTPSEFHVVTSADSAYFDFFAYFSRYDNEFIGYLPPRPPGSLRDVWAGPLLPLPLAFISRVGPHTYVTYGVSFWSEVSASVHQRLGTQRSGFALYEDGHLIDLFSGGLPSYNGTQTDRPPGSYILVGDALYPDTLSTREYMEYGFHVDAGGSMTRGPVITNLDASNIDANDTVRTFPMQVSFSLQNETAVPSVSAMFSYDHGNTWSPGHIDQAGGRYSFLVPFQEESHTISLMINSTDANGNIGNVLVADAFAFGVKSSIKVTCLPHDVGVMRGTTCRAKVTGFHPRGTVDWATFGDARLSRTACTLRRGICTIRYTPLTGGGPVGILAVYNGDSVNPATAGNFSLNVLPRRTHSYVSCTPTSLHVGYTTSLCKVRVRGLDASGMVNWTQSGPGLVQFDSDTCTLTLGICFVNVVGVTPGPVVITATYGGDISNTGSIGHRHLSINW